MPTVSCCFGRHTKPNREVRHAVNYHALNMTRKIALSLVRQSEHPYKMLNINSKTIIHFFLDWVTYVIPKGECNGINRLIRIYSNF